MGAREVVKPRVPNLPVARLQLRPQAAAVKLREVLQPATPEQVEELSAQYFTDCKENKDPLTITGLALALGFSTRQSVYDYMKDPDYQKAMGRAYLRIEHSYELQLAGGRGDGGVVFARKIDQRGFIKPLPHPERGEVRMLGFAPRMSESEVAMTPMRLAATATLPSSLPIVPPRICLSRGRAGCGSDS